MGVSEVSNIEMPEGQSFVDHLQAMFIQDKKNSDEGVYPIQPRIDKIDLPFRLWRFDKGSLRYYFEPDDEVFFPSQTTVQMCELKDGNFLTDWKIRMALLNDNADAPDLYRDERAQYGNLMHILFTETLYFGGFNIDQLWNVIQVYQQVHELHHLNVRKWLDELKKDLSAFVQWYHDHEIEPLAVELPITYPIKDENGEVILWVAGTLDLVAKAKIRRKDFHGQKYKSGKKKGQPKKTYKNVNEIIAVDYKSGKKGFYKSHEIQINTYGKVGWSSVCDRMGLDLHADSCWNFAPKDSRGAEATYSFVEQTHKNGEEYMPHLVRLFMLDGHHEVGDVRDVSGVLKVGESASENVSLKPAEEYMREHYSKKEEGDSDAS